MKEFIKISVRQNAIYIPNDKVVNKQKNITETTSVLLANAVKLGFTFSEPLLHALNSVNPSYKLEILDYLKEATGVNKNWTPLVKNWQVPTGESIVDHIITFWANAFKIKNGTPLPCGHIIPQNTFPLNRYNGCPFCGTPFEFGKIEKYGQGSKLKVLELWTENELLTYFADLLQSKTALDATQIDSLKILTRLLPIPEVTIGIKETLMIVIDYLIELNKVDVAQKYFNTPTDILRYLWYKKTGFLQIIEPKTIVKRVRQNNKHLYTVAGNSAKAMLEKKLELKLKYNRKECLMVATWLNNIDLDVEKSCEMMHPKRSIWIRFIRALRLPEYSKRKGFEKLATLLDVFYNQTYTVWQGKVNHYRLRADATQTFALLQQRPGLFARSLFANMLWFGANETIAAFTEVIEKVPARLVLTLNMYAKNYFDKNANRSVKPLGGVNKNISSNPLLGLYTDEQLDAMKIQIEDLCILTMKKRFASIPNENKTIFIDSTLYNMPVAIGDRSETIQDLPSALMGTKYTIEGNTIRLFMQWGKGLPAQHLDMDLSCHISYENRTEICSYSNLVATGCKHSGDIRSIPNKIGTAEYIEIDIEKLQNANAKYVTFTCNAYSNGSITPNLVVGWMNSKFSMKISERTGVAYDPSCVQHQISISQSATKGLVFGVLDVAKIEIIWLEMAFNGQIVQSVNIKGVKSLLAKLNSKLNIGNLLELKAEAQGLQKTAKENADEVYDYNWAINAASVTKLLID